jgi:hypothetical protein
MKAAYRAAKACEKSTPHLSGKGEYFIHPNGKGEYFIHGKGEYFIHGKGEYFIHPKRRSETQQT